LGGFSKEVGVLHGDVVVKSDQEPAIEILVEDLGKYKAGEGQRKICGGEVGGGGESGEWDGGACDQVGEESG
jgi:hypothetical protein